MFRLVTRRPRGQCFYQVVLVPQKFVVKTRGHFLADETVVGKTEPPHPAVQG